jgi:hypothetical protein
LIVALGLIIILIEIVPCSLEEDDSSSPPMLGGDLPIMLASIVLHNFQLTSKLVVMGFDLGYWVKP